MSNTDYLTPQLVVVKEFSGNYRINDVYRPIAECLVKKFPELKHIAVTDILFIDNIDGTGKSGNKIKMAQVGKIPEKWQDIIIQTTGHTFEYFMEFFRYNTERLSREQIVAVMYHELRHIGPEGDVLKHDIEDWANMVYKLGTDWQEHGKFIPDLLDADVHWDAIVLPSLFGECTATLRVVK